jgi:hypothetical protein
VIEAGAIKKTKKFYDEDAKHTEIWRSGYFSVISLVRFHLPGASVKLMNHFVVKMSEQRIAYFP